MSGDAQPTKEAAPVIRPELLEELLAAAGARGLTGKDGLLKQLTAALLNKALEAEMSEHRETGHLKLSLESAPMLDVIGFRFAEKAPLTEGPVDLAFQVSIDEFRSVSRLSLKLKDLRGS